MLHYFSSVIYATIVYFLDTYTLVTPIVAQLHLKSFIAFTPGVNVVKLFLA
jgi:hypothetical protein